MNYTIENINNEIGLGYIFLDEYRHTIIIVYTENAKDHFINVFEKRTTRYIRAERISAY